MQEEKLPITDVTQLPDKLTPGQVSRWLQLSLTVIYELCRDDVIPHKRICRAGSKKGRGVIRFDKQELIKWWSNQEKERASV
jgi:Helix-turn-helix domain